MITTILPLLLILLLYPLTFTWKRMPPLLALLIMGGLALFFLAVAFMEEQNKYFSLFLATIALGAGVRYLKRYRTFQAFSDQS
ncbi:hypothetical protein [Rhodothermus profundi]|uniref:Uncharacterized protein n=1 Tax=Rhodothermus profundi TaxID=633813 RepID=A0A1M6WUL6_9BACT|nr:hypothetical protein [Rhodothermus profundi]SHK97334.1 hypothetical protein SAMN04488087_2437 [Rhodothermus profundi]